MTTRTKAILSLSGIFIVGAICGAAIVGLIVRDRVVEMQSMRERDGFIKIFADRLHLTETQRDSLKDELAQAYEELHALRRATAAEYGEVFDTLASRIGPKLTPEQRDILRRQEDRVLPGSMRERENARGPNPPRTAPSKPPSRDTVATDTTPPPIPSAPAPRIGANRLARGPLNLQSPRDSTGTPADTSEEAIGRRLLAEIVDAYRTGLTLDDTQTNQVRRIVGHFLKRSRDIRDNSMGMRERNKRLKVNFRLMHVRIYEDVLTDDQRKLYPEMPFEVLQIIRRYLPKRGME